MATKEVLITLLRTNPQGLTIEEVSSRARLNRQTVVKYLAELKGEGKIFVRSVGMAKLNYWIYKKGEVLQK